MRLALGRPHVRVSAQVPPAPAPAEVRRGPRSARKMEVDRMAVALLPARATKTVYFVRHGEGWHNVAGAVDNNNYKLEKYFDAHLTELGWEQARAAWRANAPRSHPLTGRTQAEALKTHIAAQPKPLTRTLELVVVSPLTRAVETAIGAFGGGPATSGPLLMLPQDAVEGVRAARPGASAAGVPPFVACELCREHLGVHPCDRRRSLSHLKQRFPAVDWSNIESEADTLWTADVRESDEHLAKRAATFLRWLMARPEQHIAVVTHSSWLSVMTNHFAGECSVSAGTHLKRWFNNAELRTVVLHDRSGEEWGWGTAGSDWVGGDEGVAAVAAMTGAPAAMEN